jgi:hypothetical protein
MRHVALLICTLGVVGCPDVRSFSYLRAESDPAYRVTQAWVDQPTNEEAIIDLPFGSRFRVSGRDNGDGLHLSVTAELAALDSAFITLDYVVLTCASGGAIRVPLAASRATTVTTLNSAGYGKPIKTDGSFLSSERSGGPLYRGPRGEKQRFDFELPMTGCDPKPVVVTLPPVTEASTTTAPPPIKFFLAKFRYVGLQPVQ